MKYILFAMCLFISSSALRMNKWNNKTKANGTANTAQHEAKFAEWDEEAESDVLKALRTEKTSKVSREAHPLLDCSKCKSSTQMRSKSGKQFAYAMVIGGVNSNRDSYMGYVLNAMIARRKLGRAGSLADFVVLIEFENWSRQNNFPEAQLLIDAGIRVMYLPPWKGMPETNGNTFRYLMMRKLDVLCLDEYAAVQFMDSDIMPTTNMDYAFSIIEKSVSTHVFGAGVMEPIQGGWFMVTPSCSDHDTLMAVIRDKGLKMEPNGTADADAAWGAPIPEWTNRRTTGHGWNFNGGYADQGLFYYFARFLSNGTAAIFYDDHFETWSSDGQKHIHSLKDDYKHPGFIFQGGDYEHFTGPTKPWLGAVDQRSVNWRAEFDDLKASLPQHASSLAITFPLQKPTYGFHG